MIDVCRWSGKSTVRITKLLIFVVMAGMSVATFAGTGSGEALNKDAARGPLEFHPWQSSSPAMAVPLQPGLTIITAIAEREGDYESIKQIEKISADSVSLSYHADNLPGSADGPARSKPGDSLSAHRTVRRVDLRSANRYAQLFSPSLPETIPGSTAISVSQNVLAELKQKGKTSFSFHAGGLQGAIGSLLGGLTQSATTGRDDALSSLSWETCTLELVEKGRLAVPVLLNDRRVYLPAIHARCETDDATNDFFILDDQENPLMLAWRLGEEDETLQVVKISYAEAQRPKLDSASRLEQELQEQKRAEVYGIYFDFASDKIKPESEPVLREISELMKKHPDWKLRVEGHTDNIGTANSNLSLSERRARAVQQALVVRYHIASPRLQPSGFGDTQPKEPNNTLAGRARNRRVELVRE